AGAAVGAAETAEAAVSTGAGVVTVVAAGTAAAAPCGANAGTAPAPAVTGWISPPRASIMAIAGWPEASVWKAMALPSGDHVGQTSRAPGELVRLTSRSLWRSTVKMS